MGDQKTKGPHDYKNATWKEIEKFLKEYQEWYTANASTETDQDSGGQPTPPPPPPPGGH